MAVLVVENDVFKTFTGTTFWNMRAVFSKEKRVESELTDENKHLKKLNREKSRTHYQF